MNKKEWEKPDFDYLIFSQTQGENPSKPNLAPQEDFVRAGFDEEGNPIFVENDTVDAEAPS